MTNWHAGPLTCFKAANASTRSFTIEGYGRSNMHRLFLASTKFFVALSCCMFFGMVRPSVAQTDLSGYWDVRTPNPSGDGTFRDTYFEIQQTGETIGGTLIRR